MKIALNEYKREKGQYPETFDFDDETRSFILLHSLYGTHEPVEGVWERLEPEEYSKSLLPMESLSIAPFEVDEQGQFNLAEVDHYLIDPWGEAYIYEFERKDGNLGFLLYSKGPDRKSEPFTDISDGFPEKRPEDKDNIPQSEPGNW